LAKKIIKPIINDDGLNEDKSSDLISYIKDSFDFETFKELAAEIADIPQIKDENLINLGSTGKFVGRGLIFQNRTRWHFESC